MTTNQYAVFYSGTNRTILQPVTPPNGATMIAWAPQLIFSPGYYAYNAPVYNLTAEGLYQFVNPGSPLNSGNNTTNMIVFNGNVLTLLSSLAWLTVMGVGDAQQTNESPSAFIARVSARARTSILRMECDNTCEWAQSILNSFSIVNRLVYFLTMETPNDYVDGHTCLEMQINGQWALIDLLNNCAFEDQNGNWLSAAKIPAAIVNNTASRVWLSNDTPAVEPFTPGLFDATSYARANLASQSDLVTWQERIMQGVGIETTTGTVEWMLPNSATQANIAWVESLESDYIVGTEQAFMGLFYPG